MYNIFRHKTTALDIAEEKESYWLQLKLMTLGIPLPEKRGTSRQIRKVYKYR